MIFDLDGTLVDSLPGIAEALNLALAEHDLPTYTLEEVTKFIGKGARALADLALGKEKADLGPVIFEGFQHHYKETWKSGTHHFPGIPELLDRLHGTGMPLAVLSNKPHHHTCNIVKEMFADHLFNPVYGARDGVPSKPDPHVALEIAASWNLSAEEVCYVGDSTVDLETARNAGMIPAILNWGYGAPDNEHLLTNIAELEEFVANPS
ncbi:MAG: HAD family hydrolase [Akkermansiaceae bacterium]